MEVENAAGKCRQELGVQDAHESGEKDRVHVVAAKLIDPGLLCIGEELDRDPAMARELDRARILPVAREDHDVAAQSSRARRIGQGAEVRASARGQDRESGRAGRGHSSRTLAGTNASGKLTPRGHGLSPRSDRSSAIPPGWPAELAGRKPLASGRLGYHANQGWGRIGEGAAWVVRSPTARPDP